MVVAEVSMDFKRHHDCMVYRWTRETRSELAGGEVMSCLCSTPLSHGSMGESAEILE